MNALWSRDKLNRPRLLNGCAKSKFIADAFEALGWDTWTCDILPAEGPGNHIQDDVMKHLDDGWDMGIFHPDCTRLANSGVRWYHERPELQPLVKDAADFFNRCLYAKIPLICIENPIQHKYAREFIRIYDQIVQPHYFGEPESKATCLWLVGLPKLIRTHWMPKESIRQSVWREGPNPQRKANRSRTFPAIAQAMAEQWGTSG